LLFKAIYLIAIPAAFFVSYYLYANRRESKARAAQSSVSSGFIRPLLETVSMAKANMAHNSEIDVNLIREFLPYGLTLGKDGKYHIDHLENAGLFQMPGEGLSDDGGYV
jgi:hypothetical protein